MRQTMPSRETLWVVPLVVIGLLVAMSLTIFLSPAIGVPLLVLAAVFGLVVRLRRQATGAGQVEEIREHADPGVEFTERDRETLTS
jgi:hypothetical protein